MTPYRVTHSGKTKPTTETAYDFALECGNAKLRPFELGAFYALVVALEAGGAIPVAEGDCAMLTNLEAKGLVAINWARREIAIQGKKGNSHA